jgi:hypothetical protein
MSAFDPVQMSGMGISFVGVGVELATIGQLESNARRWDAKAAETQQGHKRMLIERRAQRSRDLAERLRRESCSLR